MVHQNGAELRLPKLVKVKRLVSSRYSDGSRPISWDLRVSGFDRVELEDGNAIQLLSDGGQSPPQSGWSLMLLRHDSGAFRWTLYALPVTAPRV